MGALAPPRVLLSWTASNLGSVFGGYNVYRRPTRAAAADWERVGELRVPSGRAPATVEAQHTLFVDWEAGWAGPGVSRWSDGWDYAVTAVNATTGLEQSVDVGVSARTVPADVHPWVTSNRRPFNSFPLERSHRSFEDDSGFASDPVKIAGRDQVTTRTRLELPSRNQSLEADFFSQDGEDPLRYWRAAAASGERFCLHLPLGDRVLGTLDAPAGEEQTDALYLAVKGALVETSRVSAVAECNVPCGVVLDGSADYMSVPDADTLDPASSAFTVVVVFAPTTTGGSDWMLSKGSNPASADGYGISTTGNANEVQFVANGASATATLTGTSSGWFDSSPYGHVFLGSSSGTAQRFTVDGVLVDSDSVTTGAISNSTALAVGALNAGASAHCAGKAFAVAVWKRQLTETEEQAATYYLLGYPGYRMPYGPTLFVDLRDDRCWNGLGSTVKDLSRTRNNGTLVSSPPVQGFPWRLSDLERFG